MVDIDFLYDLRLALVGKVNPPAVRAVLEDKLWYLRINDKFVRKAANMDRKAYNSYYKNNFIDLIKSSYVTYLANNLIPYTNAKRDEHYPGIPGAKRLIVNIPFSRMEDADIDLLANQLLEFYGGYFDDVRIMHIPYSKLDNVKLTNELKVDDYFCYGYQRWMRANYEKFESQYRPSFRVWLPKLLADADVEWPDNADEILQTGNIFEFMQFAHSVAFDIRWLEVEDACIYLPETEELK